MPPTACAERSYFELTEVKAAELIIYYQMQRGEIFSFWLPANGAEKKKQGGGGEARRRARILPDMLPEAGV